MKPRRKGKPYNPAAPVHDRRSTDLLRNAQVAAIEVDDPMALEPGDKIMALRSMRDDPLARLHDRGHIDEAQYHAGRSFQHDFEVAERGPQAIDPSKEYVDGGKLPEPITEQQRKAVGMLARVYEALGQNGSALIHSILIDRQTMDIVCEIRGMSGIREKLYLGRRFRECLEELAVIYGFAMKQ
jgi:hypothetical protein